MKVKKLVIALLAVTVAGCSKNPDAARREYVRSGDEYVKRNQLNEAIVQYRNAVQQDPRFGEARFKLAEAYAQLGDAANAYREYIRAADLLPADDKAQLRAAYVLLSARQYQDAQARAERVLQHDPKNTDAQIFRANALVGLNQLDAAISDLEAALQSGRGTTAQFSNLGDLQLRKGNRELAQEAFKKAIATDPKSVSAHLALANFYWSGGNTAGAEEELKAALGLDAKNVLANRAYAAFCLSTGRPAEAEPFLKTLADGMAGNAGKITLADYYVARGRVDEAKSVLNGAATAANPQVVADAKLRLAGLDIKAGALDAAQRRIDDVLKTAPAYPDALIARAQVLTAQNRLDDALTAARQATEAGGTSAAAFYALGRVRLARGESAEAVAAFKDALRVDPKAAAAALELANLELASGQLADAEQFVGQALQVTPNKPEAQLLRARIALAKGDLTAAELAIRAIGAAHVDSPVLQTEIGKLQLARGKRVEARTALERAVHADPANVDAVAALTRIDLAEKKQADAKARLSSALTSHPKDSRLLVVAADAYTAMGDVPSAEQVLKRAVEADSRSVDAYARLGNLYAAQGRLPEAIQEFDNIAARQPKSVPAQTMVGMLLQIQNRTQEARARYQKVLEIDPSAAVAANNLAWIQAENGDNLDIALQLAQTAKSQLPDRAEVNDTLGWIYSKKKLHTLALPPLKQAVEADPKNAGYKYHLGLAYAGAGDAKNARAALQQALQLDPNAADAAAARAALQALPRN